MRIIKLGELLTESTIVSDNPNPDKRITVKLNLGGIVKRPLKEDGGATNYYVRSKGQFIYGKQNLFKGAFGIIPEELDGFESTVDLPCFDVREDCYPEWIVRYLQSGKRYKNLLSQSKGSGAKRVNPEKLYMVDIPFPDKYVQKELLEKFSKTEKFQNEILNELAEQKKYISKLRQSILQQAIEGKLVEQDPNDEPASVLLKAIAKEKKKLIDEKKLKKPKPLPPITDEEKVFTLPQGWEWCRLGEISKSFRYGTSLPSSYEIDGTPILRIPNLIIETATVDISDIKYAFMPQTEVKELLLEPCDMLMIRSNGSPTLVGRVAIVNKLDSQKYCYAGYLIRIRYFLDKTDIHYVKHLLNSSYIRKLIETSFNDTTSVKNFSASKVAKLAIPLPPLAEQKRIVEKVGKLMELCDKLEEEVATAKKYADQLLESVLQEAFSDKPKEKIIPIPTEQPFNVRMAARGGTMNEDVYQRLLAHAMEMVENNAQ